MRRRVPGPRPAVCSEGPRRLFHPVVMDDRSQRRSGGMIVQELVQLKRRELAQRAKAAGVPGWHEMTRKELLAALAKGSAVEAQEVPKRAPRRRRKTFDQVSTSACLRSPNSPSVENDQPADETDRVVLLARDPYWLQAYWAVSRAAVLRCQAALGKDWYCAKPVLRLYDVTSDDSCPGAEAVVRDVALPDPSIQHWYIDVAAAAPRSYRLDVGYLTAKGRFLAAARSNIAVSLAPHEVPAPGEVWKRIQQEADRGRKRTASEEDLDDLFRQRVRRPLSWGELERTTEGRSKEPLPFVLEAELVVHGRCAPTTLVSINDAQVPVSADGKFSLRMRLNEGRQIIPAIARGLLGDAKTIVLAVERNTRVIECSSMDAGEG